MRVMKFGGAALRDGAAIERSVRLVERAAGEQRVLLVVSAQEGVTAALAQAAEGAVSGHMEPWDALRVRHRSTLAQLGLESDLLDRHLFELRAILEQMRALGRADRRMRDYVLSFGERMSARVVAAALRKLGRSASPLDAYDLGLTTASRQGESALLCAPTPGLRATLASVPGIPVVTGFLALDANGHLTTLGPNGSDLTATWFGEAVAAEEVVLWKTVAGFMTADPDVVPEARRIPVLGREEAVEFAVNGAEVLHAGALEPAERGRFVVRIGDVNAPDAPGTRIQEHTPVAGPVGLAQHAALARYRERLTLGRDQGVQLAELSSALAQAGFDPQRLAFSGRVVEALLADEPRIEAFAAGRPAAVEIERGLASLAVIGRGVGADASLATRVRDLAARAGVALEALPGGASLAFLTGAGTLDAAVRAVHAGLFGAAPSDPGGELQPCPRERSPGTRDPSSRA